MSYFRIHDPGDQLQEILAQQLSTVENSGKWKQRHDLLTTKYKGRQRNSFKNCKPNKTIASSILKVQ